MNKAQELQNLLEGTQAISNLIRNYLSGTPRKVSKKDMLSLVQSGIKGASSKDFNKSWDDLVKDDFLIKGKDGFFRWEAI